MPTALDIAREYFPNADDATLDFFLWEYTGFPSFWGGDPGTVLRRQLTELQFDIWWNNEAEVFPY